MNIREIASLAGVSPSTVSKVLNGKDDSISQATRTNVLEVIKRHNYVPYSPCSKKSHSSHLIALSANIDSSFLPILNEIQKIVGASYYDLVVYNNFGDRQREKEQLSRIVKKKYDGLIHFTCYPENLEALSELKFPAVVADASGGGTHLVHFKSPDYAMLGLEAIKYGIHKGYKRIGLAFSDSDNITYRTKKIIEGYKQSFLETDMEYDRNLISRHGNFEKLVSNNAQLIICDREKTACALYEYCDKYKIKIGKDISLLCAEKSDLNNFSPKLSCLYLNHWVYGSLASELVARIENKQHKTPGETEEICLIEGQSIPAIGEKSKIVVVGSMNMDTFMHVTSIPLEGDNLVIDKIAAYPGGKGTNQAVGVARLGGKSCLIGCVGNDRDGRELIESLKKNNVNTEGVVIDRRSSTGGAYIYLPSNGESSISIYSGANSRLTKAHIRNYDYLFDNSKFSLISSELEYETVAAAVETAYRRKSKVIIKPSTLKHLSGDIFKKIYAIVPNLKEAEQLAPHMHLEEKADYMLSMGAANVIITMGCNGAYFKNKDMSAYYPAEDFPVVDATGGGDAFVSALAMSLMEDENIDKAIRFALVAAGISITKEGVVPALATKSQIEDYTYYSSKTLA